MQAEPETGAGDGDGDAVRDGVRVGDCSADAARQRPTQVQVQRLPQASSLAWFELEFVYGQLQMQLQLQLQSGIA